ncbi:MAG: 2-oxo acid dehydrogenase subunit E2, partial [Anaerolineae bacterium]
MAVILEMPKLGFDMAEGTLVRWVLAEGENVQKGAVIAEIETDKATVEVEANGSGVVYRHLVPEGEIVPVGTPIAVIADPGEEPDLSGLLGAESSPEAAAPPQSAAGTDSPTGGAPAPQAAAPQKGAPLPGGRVKASPLARRMAREHGLDLSTIPGSGPGGRIVKRDIEAALQTTDTGRQTTGRRPQAVLTAVQRPSATIPVSRLRQAIGRRMVEAKQQVPHFYVTHEYRMDALLAARKRINAQLEGSGVKLSVNDFLVKAVALTLREFPNLNASLVDGQIVQHGEINIGNAVAVESGLLTVVCRNADRKSLREISTEVREMARQVREGKVRSEYIEGSTFSISNLGMYDVEHFIAIINPPEAAILAVGAARQVPVVEDGQLAVGWTMKATISVDHRVSDGAEAA